MRTTKILYTEADRRYFSDELIKCGRVEAFLYNVMDPTPEDVLKYLKGKYLIATMEHNVIAGFGIFEWIDGTSYWAHFGSLKGFEHEAIERGKDVIALAQQCGCTTLLGLTPVPYRHVRKILDAWGFKQLAVLPNACYIARKNKNYDGLLTTKTLT